MPLEIETDFNEDDLAALRAGLSASNRAKSESVRNAPTPQHFCIFERNNEQAVVAGIEATLFWNGMHVERLWVDDSQQGKGLGSALLTKAEQHALAQGFEVSFLETADFQAKGFYQKQGYQVIGTLDNQPKGGCVYYLSKSLV